MEFVFRRHLSLLIIYAVSACPNTPVISTSDPSGNEVTGIEDKDVTLVCRSTGGYPKPTMTWYKTSNKTAPLATNTDQPQRDDRTYQLEYTFRANRGDDGATFICQSSCDPPDPLYMPAEIKLNLKYHPTLVVSGDNEVTEGNNVTLKCEAIAKPAPTFTWYHNGDLISEGSHESSHINALNIFTVNRTDVGVYQCKASNGYPPDGIKEINLTVKFRPLTVSITGETIIVANRTNTVKLNCTTGSSNPKSTIEWFRNNALTPNDASVQEYTGHFNGIVTSQILEFVADRNMDGDEIECRAHNEIEPHNSIYSGKKKLNLIFHPVTELPPSTSVVEGQEKTFRCNVQSKPASLITWYHHEAILSTGTETNYKIPVVNRSHAGKYRCVAVNGYLPNGNSETNLTVQYAPDVEVTTMNVTVNDSSTQVRCSPSGKPATYTFSEWQHIWPGVGPVVHKNGLGTSQTLTLSQLTYEYSGIYKCSVSNGIHGSLNPNAGYGVAYLQVETYPIITADGDFKVPGRLNKNTTATISFYFNVKDNNVECFIGNTSHACPAVFVDAKVNLPLFDTTIQTTGTIAHISFSVSSVDQFGVFNIKISNSIGYSERAIEVIPEGPPRIPEEVSIVETQRNAVILSWVPGFHGGFNQTFVIEYSIDGQNWLPDNTVEIQGGRDLQRVYGTVSNLQSSTLYFMRLMSRNEKGNSEYTRVFNVTTDLSPEFIPTGNILLPAVLGGVAAVIVVVVAVVLVLLIRKHSRKHEGEQTDDGNDMYYNIDRPVYDDLRYDGNPHAYSVLGHVANYGDLAHDTTDVQPYSNLNNVDGSHPASLADKTYESLRLSPLK